MDQPAERENKNIIKKQYLIKQSCVIYQIQPYSLRAPKDNQNPEKQPVTGVNYRVSTHQHKMKTKHTYHHKGRRKIPHEGRSSPDEDKLIQRIHIQNSKGISFIRCISSIIP